jgi:multicomponent Na+:H+ antiporter subunit E
MKSPAALHLLIALVWVFLSAETTLGSFFVALIATFLLLALFQKAIGCQDYVRRVLAFIVFCGVFIREVIASNLRIMLLALTPDAGHRRGCYIDYNIEGLTELEILLISQCIGLSPGTMVSEPSADGRYLVIHAFPSAPAKEVQTNLDEHLKNRILAFTR